MGNFFKRKKRAIAAGLATVMLAMPILSNSVSAFVLDLNNAYVADTWNENITDQALAAQGITTYEPTGMAFNQNFYFGAGTNGWPLGAAMYLEPIDGKDNSGFEDFEFRHTFCTANHTSAASIQPGARAFLSGRYKKGQVGKLPFLNVQMKTPLCSNKNICSTCKLMKTAYPRKF